MRFLLVMLTFGLFCASNTTANAQFKDDDPDTKKSKELLDKSQVQRLEIGVTVTARTGPCGAMVIQIPVPMDWPEQKVKKIKEDITKKVKGVKFATISKSVRVMKLRVPKLDQGEVAKAFVTFDVTRHSILAPEETKDFRFGTKSDKEYSAQRMHLGRSKFIETNNRLIRNTGKRVMKLAADKETDWEKIEFIYDWVREHVVYKNGPIKGALAALNDKTGDCEELTSLFVALCRVNGIPARSVWVSGHTYPEFFLLDKEGKGHWFPCQAAGTRAFGSIPERRAILQKGDNVKCPIRKKPMRYVSATIKGKKIKGARMPKISFSRKEIPID